VIAALAAAGGVLAALIVAIRLSGRRPASQPPSRTGGGVDDVAAARSLAALRDDLESGDIEARDYEALRERLAASLMLREEAPPAAPARRAWTWPVGGAIAAAAVAAALVPAIRDRGPGEFPTGNDFSAAAGAAAPGSAEWAAAERALRSGDAGAAVRSYRMAVGFLPRRADLRARFGFALAQAGRRREALDQLRRAARTAPRLADARLYLGAVLLSVDRPRAAAREWRRFLALKPDGPDARLVRHALARMGQ
jgi:tetratricopeptide (TPR) repeat protein